MRPLPSPGAACARRRAERSLGRRKRAGTGARGGSFPPLVPERAHPGPRAAGGRAALFNEEIPHLKVVTEQPEFTKPTVAA